MLRKIIYITLLSLLCILIGAGIFAYTRISDASWLASQVQTITRQHAGIDVDIKDGVKLQFSPHPTLVLGNVHVHRMDGGLSAFIEKIEVIPDIDLLFSGELHINHVEIVHPTLEIDTTLWKKNKDGIEIVKDETNDTSVSSHVQLVSTLKNIIQYVFVDELSSIKLVDADVHIVTSDISYIYVQTFDLNIAIDGKEAELSFFVEKSTLSNGSVGTLAIENISLSIPQVALKSIENTSEINGIPVTEESLLGDLQLDIGRIGFHDIHCNEDTNALQAKDVHFLAKNMLLTDDDVQGELTWQAAFAHDAMSHKDVPLRLLEILGLSQVRLPDLSIANSIQAHFAYDFAQNTVIIDDALLSLAGTVNIEDYDRAFHLRIPFTWDKDTVLSLDSAGITLDGNSLTISAVCTGLLQGDPLVKGHVDMHQLSLTQLFGFARRLPNGLQNALNDVTGQLDFELDTEKVVAPRIDAVVCGLDLTGTAHIADLRYPDLVLDIAGPYLDANKVLPEINNERPEAPIFVMKPIIPVPDEKDEPDGQAHNDDGHFGFDIRVHAKDVDVYVLSLKDLDFRCIPSEKGTLLTFDSPNMYGGLVDLHLDITDGYELEGTIKNISLAEPITILAGWPAASGVAQLAVDVKAPFRRTLKTVLDGLTGMLDIHAEQGNVVVDQDVDTKPFPYTEFSLLGHIKQEGAKPKGAPENWLSYDGTWQGHWLFPTNESGRYDLKGVVHFDFDTVLPVACDAIPAQIHVFFPESEISIPNGVALDFNAMMTAQLDRRRVEFARMKGVGRGIAFKGRTTLEGIGSSMRFSGDFVADHPSMRNLLKTINFDVWATEDENAFGPLNLTSKFNYAGGVLSLHQAQFLLDGNRYGGNIRIVDTRGSNTRPLIYFDIAVDAFDANAYFPAKSPEQENTPESLAMAEKPWDLSMWHRYDLDGRMSFGSITLFNQHFSHVFAPMELDGGLFTMDELDAVLHGGQVTLATRIDTRQSGLKKGELDGHGQPLKQDGLHAELVVNTRTINVRSLASAVTDQDYLGGKLDSAVSLSGDFACDADLRRALDGEWFVAIKDGYFSQSGQGDLREKRIGFSSATASGLVNKGLVENNNLTVDSTLLEMDGKGWIDLPTKTVDYKVDVAFARVPNIPIRITGTWDKPDVSVNGVGVVTGTLVNLGTSVFDILGSVLMAPFDFLSLIGLGVQGDTQNPNDNGSIGPQGSGVQGSAAFVPILRLPPMETPH
ncbi:MAG: AsmA-like C-terminal region-containing protein [Pseudomonadota bacterium]